MEGFCLLTFGTSASSIWTEVGQCSIDNRLQSVYKEPMANTTPKKVSRFRSNVYGGSPTYVCVCCGKRTRETGEGESGCELCLKCFNEAGIENEHLDGYHDEEPRKDCPDCVAEGKFKVEA